MAEEKEKCGELCHVSICTAENGFKICCQYENKEMSLAQRAGWVPCAGNVCKDYVEKTWPAVLARLKSLKEK
jgi:hypothetical protein